MYKLTCTMSKTNNVHFITAAVCSGLLLIVHDCINVYAYVCVCMCMCMCILLAQHPTRTSVLYAVQSQANYEGLLKYESSNRSYVLHILGN